MNKIIKNNFIIIIFLFIFLSSCSTYIPHIKDITKSETNETFLSNLEYHLDSTFETWKLSGVMKDDKSNLFQYFLFIYKITVDSNNFWIFDIGIYNNINNKKYFYEITSIDPFNILKIKKNFIQLDGSYLKWNENYLELRYKTKGFDLKINLSLNNKIRNFQILPEFSDFSNDNIYFISKDLNSEGHIYIKDKKFKINSNLKGKSYLYRFFGKTFPDKLEMFFIPIKNQSYIIVSSPKKNIIDAFLVDKTNFNKIDKVSYTYSKVLADKNRRYCLDWYFILNKSSFYLKPINKDSIYETFFEDFWTNIIKINSGKNNDILDYGIAIIDEFSRIINY